MGLSSFRVSLHVRNAERDTSQLTTKGYLTTHNAGLGYVPAPLSSAGHSSLHCMKPAPCASAAMVDPGPSDPGASPSEPLSTRALCLRRPGAVTLAAAVDVYGGMVYPGLRAPTASRACITSGMLALKGASYPKPGCSTSQYLHVPTCPSRRQAPTSNLNHTVTGSLSPPTISS